MPKLEALQSAWKYLRSHPEELVRAARNVPARKLGVPLAALRWAARRGAPRSRSTDLDIDAVPPGIRVAATLELMGARVRAAGVVRVEDIRLSCDELRLELRLTDVSLALVESSDTPVGALVQSGALDLKKLGNLVALMPKRPAYLVEARDDRIVLDLKRHDALADARLTLLLELLTPLVTVKAVRAESSHVDLEFDFLQRGVGAALEAWRSLPRRFRGP